MLYRPNLPMKERVIRIVLGIGLIAASVLIPLPAWAAWLGGALGIGFAATSVFAYCPACALAGRRLAERSE